MVLNSSSYHHYPRDPRVAVQYKDIPLQPSIPYEQSHYMYKGTPLHTYADTTADPTMTTPLRFLYIEFI